MTDFLNFSQFPIPSHRFYQKIPAVCDITCILTFFAPTSKSDQRNRTLITLTGPEDTHLNLAALD